jgi:hypothetical protein
MYSLPLEFDESTIVNATLYEIGFNANQIRLSFAPKFSIVVEGEMRLRFDQHEELIVSASTPRLELLRLIEATIKAVVLGNSRSEMELRFSGDVYLTLLVDDNYESYTIETEKKSYIV